MLLSHEAGAEPVAGLGTWGGEVELAYERERQNTRTSGSPDIELNRLRYDERLGIRNQGFFIMDPRLFTGNLGLTFDLFQEHDRIDGGERYQNGKLTGYAFDAGLLNEKPYSAAMFANRNENIFNRDYGGRSEIAYENRGANLRLREDSFLRDWGIPYLNTTVGVREEHIQEATTLFAQQFQRDETRHVASLEANKGFVNSDLGFRYEQTDVVDQARPQSAFQTQMANLTYSLDFGPTLNRRWSSNVYYLDRTDNNPVTFLTVDEQLRIDHHQDLFTDYRYALVHYDTQTGTTTTQTGIFQAHQRLYKNLTTDYKAQGQTQYLPNGERSNYAGQIDLNYQRSLTPDRRVFARLGGRHQLDDNELTTSRIDVVDEPHTAPSPLGVGVGFTLGNPLVSVATITVVDTRGGGRIPTTPGIDYEIVQEGDFTKVIPLAASTAIQPGDPLAVSYSYETAPSMRFSTDSWWLSGGIDFRWLAFSFAHEQYGQTLLSGQDGRFLDDRRTDTVQLELRGDWKRVQTRATALSQAYDSTRLAYTRRQFNQFLTARLGFDFTLGLQAEESFTDFTVPVRTSKTRSLRATLDRYVVNGWYVSAFAGTRVLDDSDLPTETLREAGAQARRTLGKLDIVPSLAWSRFERGTIETADWRLMLRATRRF